MRGEGILSVRFEGRWSEKSRAVEAYTRMGLVSMAPQKIFNQKVRYRQKWTCEHVVYLATNVLETEGTALKHPFVTSIKQNFPEYMKNLTPALPAVFPAKGVSNRMARNLDNRESKVYLSQMVEKSLQQAVLQRRRSEISKDIRKRKYRTLYGKKLPIGVQAAMADILGVRVSKDAQTDEAPMKIRADQETQTPAVTVAVLNESEEEQQIEERKQELNKRSGLWREYPKPQPGKLHPEAANLFRGPDDPVLYNVVVQGQRKLITAAQYGELFPDKPRVTGSKEQNAKKSIKRQIRRRISRRFREREDEVKASYLLRKKGLDMEKQVVARRTASIVRLEELFMANFISEGYRGLPPKVEAMDPISSDEEWEAFIINEYRRKPWNYESERKARLTEEFSHVHEKRGSSESARSLAKAYLKNVDQPVRSDEQLVQEQEAGPSGEQSKQKARKREKVTQSKSKRSQAADQEADTDSQEVVLVPKPQTRATLKRNAKDSAHKKMLEAVAKKNDESASQETIGNSDADNSASMFSESTDSEGEEAESNKRRRHQEGKADKTKPKSGKNRRRSLSKSRSESPMEES